MPMHDWTRVTAGIFHDFHTAWISAIRLALNAGLLPPEYYALAEQVAGDIGPDVLTLRAPAPKGVPHRDDPYPADVRGGGVAVAVAAKPVVRFRLSEIVTEEMKLTARQRRIAIRHTTGDGLVAVIEIASPGNKHSGRAVRAFVDKAVAAVRDGLHLLVVDPFPPGGFDPAGLHAAIWSALGGYRYTPPPGEPLTLSAYVASDPIACHVEPTAVGRPLTPAPLFLTAERCVEVPLEATYAAAYAGVPRRWREVIEAA